VTGIRHNWRRRVAFVVLTAWSMLVVSLGAIAYPDGFQGGPTEAALEEVVQPESSGMSGGANGDFVANRPGWSFRDWRVLWDAIGPGGFAAFLVPATLGALMVVVAMERGQRGHGPTGKARPSV